MVLGVENHVDFQFCKGMQTQITLFSSQQRCGSWEVWNITTTNSQVKVQGEINLHKPRKKKTNAY
jgi:hypothetical protein